MIEAFLHFIFHSAFGMSLDSKFLTLGHGQEWLCFLIKLCQERKNGCQFATAVWLWNEDVNEKENELTVMLKR